MRMYNESLIRAYDRYIMGEDDKDPGAEFVDDCASCGKEIYDDERYCANGRIVMCMDCYEQLAEVGHVW